MILHIQISFYLTKMFLNKEYEIICYYSLNEYYVSNLKLSGNKVLKKIKNYTFIKIILKIRFN